VDPVLPALVRQVLDQVHLVLPELEDLLEQAHLVQVE
jgi:hypothetical protein